MSTTVFQSLLKNSIQNRVDAQEIEYALLAWKNKGIGVLPGILDRIDIDFPVNSSEFKLYRKISDYSYEYHALDDKGEYIHPENEDV